LKKIWQEIEEARAQAAAEIQPVVPNEDERRAGWDEESLTAYVAERNAAADLKIDKNSMFRRNRPHEQNHRYRPHRWRNA
jgi:hypothetical protein